MSFLGGKIFSPADLLKLGSIDSIPSISGNHDRCRGAGHAAAPTQVAVGGIITPGFCFGKIALSKTTHTEPLGVYRNGAT